MAWTESTSKAIRPVVIRGGIDGGFKEAEHVAAAGQLEKGQHKHMHAHICRGRVPGVKKQRCFLPLCQLFFLGIKWRLRESLWIRCYWLEKKDAAGKRTDLGQSVRASKAILMTKAVLSRLHGHTLDTWLAVWILPLFDLWPQGDKV